MAGLLQLWETPLAQKVKISGECDPADTEVETSGEADAAGTEVETSGGSDDAGEKKKDDKDATK